MLLYELADLPALSSAVLEDGDFGGLLPSLFQHRDVFGKLGANGSLSSVRDSPKLPDDSALDLVLSEDALSLAEYEQGRRERSHQDVTRNLIRLAQLFSLEWTGTEIEAFRAVIERRYRHATRAHVDDGLFTHLEFAQFPAELWTTQIQAVNAGLMDETFDSWGFAAPTGTGKTFLARLLITDILSKNPSAKILYVVPTKALVQEVFTDLSDYLSPLGYDVVKVSPQIVELAEDEEDDLADTSVAVLTPEKADLLLRLGASFAADLEAIVVDEAHHIDSGGTRGGLLELYLWRIKKLFGNQTRIVYLSAVAPNIRELAEWTGDNPGGEMVDRRSTRMRAGVYKVRKHGGRNEGWIEYTDDTEIQIIDERVETGVHKGIAQLSEKLQEAGPVLVVAKGKRTCEKLAKALLDRLDAKSKLQRLSKGELESEEYLRLDSRLEREMYSKVEMRDYLPFRIAYHHAGLPPRVRVAVEDAIRQGLIDFVFATTTLSEGVNFPFSSVVVQQLALREPPEKGKSVRYSPVTPRSFWNIAGRAGRPFQDSEGQVILYSPTLKLEKIDAVIEPYLNPSLSDAEPVGSALANGIKELIQHLDSEELGLGDLGETKLPESLSRTARGTINLLRVGLIHAEASEIQSSTQDLIDESFAAQHLDTRETAVAHEIAGQQQEAVDSFFASVGAPPIEMAAELGLSLDTLDELKNYARRLDNWQIEKIGELFYGGNLNHDQAVYIVGPVAKRMTELEGRKLGGFYGNIVVEWLCGVPLADVHKAAEFAGRLEKLIRVLFSRVQFLLPWGLYAYDRILTEECERRDLNYNNEVLKLAYLVDSGVPNFDALRLTSLDFERVDATRLSRAYAREKIYSDTSVVGWVASLERGRLIDILSGSDGRRIDSDLDSILSKIGA